MSQITAKQNRYTIQLLHSQMPGYFHVGQIRNPNYEKELAEYDPDSDLDAYYTEMHHWEHGEMINRPGYPNLPVAYFEVFARVEEVG